MYVCMYVCMHAWVQVKMLDGPDVDQVKSYHPEELTVGNIDLPPISADDDAADDGDGDAGPPAMRPAQVRWCGVGI